VRFQDEAGAQRIARIGACEINLSRVMAAIVETGHDERGIVWPPAIAPYSVVLTPIQYDGATREATDRLYTDLLTAGVDVLLDDRDMRAGAKFADADLIGIPIRINIGDRGLKRGVVELKRRTAADAVEIELGQAVEAVLALSTPTAGQKRQS
jgi:prolyl-tRNA synthetase